MENKEKLPLLKEQLRKINIISDVFKWVGILFVVAFVLTGLVALATLKNVENKVPIIVILIVEVVLAACFLVLHYLQENKAKNLKKEGISIDKEFSILIEEDEMHKVDRNAKISKVVYNVFVYIFLIFMGLIILFPFYWMINSSLKTLAEYKLTVPTFWPKHIELKEGTIVPLNYANAYNTANLGILFINTLYVGLVSTILSLIITVLSAFAFARLDFKGKGTLFAALLATMMIPGELFTITNYSTIMSLSWQNTFSSLIIPFLVSVFYIYLLRQNFMQIPNELYLAAKVDGTSDFKYLTKVMIPLSLPTLISITILKMMGAWNSYVWPNLVANDKAHRLITNGLRNSFTDSVGEVNYPEQMAAVALVSLPLFLVFIFLRKYIMKGVSRSGIKG